jgi:hypothetical protein
MNTGEPAAGLRVCPICRKHVDIEGESHTLTHCRNYLLQLFYREGNRRIRLELDRKIENLNARLGLRSKNLLDT